jgi:hypothetical protein
MKDRVYSRNPAKRINGSAGNGAVSRTGKEKNMSQGKTMIASSCGGNAIFLSFWRCTSAFLSIPGESTEPGFMEREVQVMDF